MGKHLTSFEDNTNTLAYTALGVVLGILLSIVLLPVNRPNLIGFGCVGANGFLYANEEDHFPPCKRIEINE